MLNSEKQTEMEKFLVVGHLCGVLAEQGKISFTKDFDYDGEMFQLAERLIREFDNEQYSKYGYFSEFVESRLLQIEKDMKG